MPFLFAEILDFQGSAHLIGVGSLSNIKTLLPIKIPFKSNSNILTVRLAFFTLTKCIPLSPYSSYDFGILWIFFYF